MIQRLRTSLAIGRVTFREILLDKVLYNLILFGLLLLGVGLAASEMSFISPDRIILDFGFTAINLACFLLAALHGSTIFPKEYDRRTVWVILARPITKAEFVLGKWLGLAGVILLNWALLGAVEIGLYTLAGGALSATLFKALFLLLLQSWMLAALAFIFSSFTTTSISVMVMIGLYLVGNSASSLQTIAAKSSAEATRLLVQVVTSVFPNFEKFNLGFTVTYHLPIEGKFIAGSTAYAVIWIILSLGIASFLLDRRQGEA